MDASHCSSGNCFPKEMNDSGWDTAQVVERLPNKPWVGFPQRGINQTRGHMPRIPALQRWEQEVPKFKIIPSHTASLRPG